VKKEKKAQEGKVERRGPRLSSKSRTKKKNASTLKGKNPERLAWEKKKAEEGGRTVVCTSHAPKQKRPKSQTSRRKERDEQEPGTRGAEYRTGV